MSERARPGSQIVRAAAMMTAAARPREIAPEQRENNGGGVTGKGFVKGQSGNPAGRPKGSGSITREIRRLVSANDGERGVLIAEALIARAISGHVPSIRIILDRVDGPMSKWRPEPCRCEQEYDFARLSESEQRELFRLLDKAKP